MSSFGFGIFSQVSYLLSVFAGQHVCQRCHGHPAHVLGGTIRFYILSRLNLEKLESLWQFGIVCYWNLNSIADTNRNSITMYKIIVILVFLHHTIYNRYWSVEHSQTIFQTGGRATSCQSCRGAGWEWKVVNGCGNFSLEHPFHQCISILNDPPSRVFVFICFCYPSIYSFDVMEEFWMSSFLWMCWEQYVIVRWNRCMK